jgi:hypothetical protein
MFAVGVDLEEMRYRQVGGVMAARCRLGDMRRNEYFFVTDERGGI